MKRRFLKLTSMSLCAVMVLTGSFITSGDSVYATSIADMQKQQRELQTEVDELQSKLVDLLTEIDSLEAEISDNEDSILETKEELKEAKKAEKKQYKDMKLRIRYFYENGEKQDIFTLLLSSGSFTDFINRMSYVNSVYEYDKDRLAAYKATKEEIKAMEADLEVQQKKLEGQKASLKTKKSDLDSLISSKQGQVADLGNRIQKAKEEAARKAAEEAARRAREQAEANARRAREQAERERRAAEAAAQQNSSTGGGGGNSGSSTPNTGGGDPEPVTDVSGGSVVAYAKQFVGNPYKWGGDSLTSGCDCSGFVVQVYKHFGINLSGSRQSALLRSVGRAVSYDSIQPGDIVCYSGHVAIYAGGGVIVEAQSTRAGITCSRSVTCKEILAIRRVI